MINNQIPKNRNNFYDRIFSNTVTGRDCIEIGFGTGLLTMLALKHGAKSVEAWENNFHLYQLGVYLIDQLKLNDRVKLNHGTFDNSISTVDKVVFHEILSPNVWGEGLRSACPLDSDLILPSEIYVGFEQITIPRQLFNSIWLNRNQLIDPEVVVYPGWRETLNSILKQSPMKTIKREQVNISGDIVDFYQINFNKKTINSKNFTQIPDHYSRNYTANIDNSENIIVMWPFSKIIHKTDSEFFCWFDPVFAKESGNYCITHNFTNGDLCAELI